MGMTSIPPHAMRPGDVLVREQETVKTVGSTFRQTPEGPLRRTIICESGAHIVKREGELCQVMRE